MLNFAKFATAVCVASFALVITSCTTDYAIYGGETEYIYVEVEVLVEDTAPPVDPEPGEVWVDHFYQSSVMDGIDILWVIDRSGSMNTHQTRLLDGIAAMMTALPATNWRLAMLSADGSYASTETLFPLLPGDTLADAETMYNAIGNGQREEGFDAAYEYITNNSYAATWMRNDAALLVVFVSDEEEQGTNFSSAIDFVHWYSLVRDYVFLASIVNFDPAVSTCNGSSINVGDRYMEATNLLSGTVVDICSEDWTPGVAEAAVEMEPKTEIELTHLPIEETIRVFTDGALYDSANWYYEPSINTVIFTETDATSGELTGPPPNTLVEVGYVIEKYNEESSDTGDTGS